MLYTLRFKLNSAYNFTCDSGGHNFRIHIRPDLRHNSYFMDIEMRNGSEYRYIARCISLLCGSDLFIPFHQYGLGSFMVLALDAKYYDKDPTPDTLVDNYIMVWEHD